MGAVYNARIEQAFEDSGVHRILSKCLILLSVRSPLDQSYITILLAAWLVQQLYE